MRSGLDNFITGADIGRTVVWESSRIQRQSMESLLPRFSENSHTLSFRLVTVQSAEVPN